LPLSRGLGDVYKRQLLFFVILGCFLSWNTSQKRRKANTSRSAAPTTPLRVVVSDDQP
jgi:hypothetical protein